MTSNPNQAATHRELAVLTERVRALDERLRVQREADRESLNLARTEINRRLEGMNELRTQIESERGRFTDRTLHDLLVERVSENSQRLSRLEGRAVGYAAGAGMAATAVAVILRLVGG